TEPKSATAGLKLAVAVGLVTVTAATGVQSGVAPSVAMPTGPCARSPFGRNAIGPSAPVNAVCGSLAITALRNAAGLAVALAGGRVLPLTAALIASTSAPAAS